MRNSFTKATRRRCMQRTAWFLSVPTLMLFMTSSGCGQGGPNGKEHPAVGKKLADLKVQGLTGDADNLELSQLSGRVVLIHFWGTWCPPCVKETPKIAGIAEAHRGRDDFSLLAISSAMELNPDLAALRKETEGFLAKKELDLPTYADVDDKTRSSFHEVAGWRGYPATMVLDGKGVIRGVWNGYQEGDESKIEALLAELLAS